MASHAHITRRAALLGAAVSSAALAVPVVASTRQMSSVDERIRQHSEKLLAALSEKYKLTEATINENPALPFPFVFLARQDMNGRRSSAVPTGV